MATLEPPRPGTPLSQTPDASETGITGTARLAQQKLLADGLQRIPIVYGRRRLPGIVIESSIQKRDTVWQKVIFALLSEGPIDSVERFYIDGEEAVDTWKKHPITQAKLYKKRGIFYRRGVAGFDDTETEAEYDADPETQERSQNRDYRSSSDQTYAGAAYAIVVLPDDEDVDTLPDVAFDVRGVRCQHYLANGNPDGSPVWTDSPIWQLLELLQSTKHGLGLGSSRFDYAVAKASADYCAEALASTEASTTISASQGTATTACLVASTEGFVAGRTIKINGVDNTVRRIVGDKELELGTAVTQTAGHTVVQYAARFGSHFIIRDQGELPQRIKQVLLACRGFITYDAGKIQPRIERPLEDLVTNGGFENWSSATDADDWAEEIAGGTVNREASAYEGSYCLRFDRTSSSNLMVWQVAAKEFIPGAFYRLSFRARGSVYDSLGAYARLKNHTRGTWLQSDGSWDLALGNLLYGPTPTTWTPYTMTFQIPVTYDKADTYWIYLYGVGAAIGQSLYYDNYEIRGPFAGHFRDLGGDIGYRIKSGSFRWETQVRGRDVNRVEVPFINDGSDSGRDAAVANDWDHQKTRPLRIQTLRAETIADRDQAQRVADFALAKARSLGPGASFRGETGAVIVQPGDAVLVTHEVPGWTAKECRVTKKSLLGPGDNDELFVDLTVEGLDESIYGDTGADARNIPARTTPTLTLTAEHATGKLVQLQATLSAAGHHVRAYQLHRGLEAGFDPGPDNRVKHTKNSRIIYWPIETELDQTLYFVARALTDRGAIVSAEISVYAGRIAADDLDGSSTQRTSPSNLVYDGDFGDTANWTESAATATQDLFSTANTGGTIPYGSPTNANNKSDGTFASGSVTGSGDKAEHEWHGFGTGTRGGTLYVRHDENNAAVAQVIKYSDDDGQSWSTLGTSNGTITTDSVVLDDVDLAKLRVKAETDWVSGLGGAGRVYQIYFVEDSGLSVVDGTGYEDVARLRGDHLGADSSVERAFPVQSTETIRHLPADSAISVLISAKRDVAGEALDDDVVVYLEEVGGPWTQDILTIPAASVLDAWGDFASAGVIVDSGIPAAALRVGVRTGSTAGVQLDKLAIWRGCQVFPFLTHPSEQNGSTGRMGNFGTGAAGGGSAPPGSGWDPDNLIKPPNP